MQRSSSRSRQPIPILRDVDPDIAVVTRVDGQAIRVRTKDFRIGHLVYVTSDREAGVHIVGAEGIERFPAKDVEVLP